jgi:hypothetical protein
MQARFEAHMPLYTKTPRRAGALHHRDEIYIEAVTIPSD